GVPSETAVGSVASDSRRSTPRARAVAMCDDARAAATWTTATAALPLVTTATPGSPRGSTPATPPSATRHATKNDHTAVTLRPLHHRAARAFISKRSTRLLVRLGLVELGLERLDRRSRLRRIRQLLVGRSGGERRDCSLRRSRGRRARRATGRAAGEQLDRN